MLEQYGYPFKSKEHSLYLSVYQNSGVGKTVERYLNRPNARFRCPDKLRYQFTEDFKIKVSNKCCYKLKKDVVNQWAKENYKTITITGMRAGEGGLRASHKGCAVFDETKLVKFHPLQPLEDDFMEWYIAERKIELCRLYYPPFNFKRTGSIGLNAALGVGGYPRGRIIEIYGPESSGKTTLAIHAIAEAQKQGGIAAFIDAEHAFDRFYAQKLGVDMDNLWISQPDNGEQALEIADQLIRSSAVDIIVVDSVAALTPKAEIEGDMGENKVGLHARLMSQALRKLTSNISKTNTTCIFINQLREKIGVMFGNPETTTGGNALKFYASVRIDIRRGTSIKDGDEVKGNQTKVKVVKNKVAPPFRKAEFDIMFGTGISKSGELIDLGTQLGIVKKSGSWYSYQDQKLAQGRDASKQLMEDNPELAEEIEAKIMAQLTGKQLDYIEDNEPDTDD